MRISAKSLVLGMDLPGLSPGMDLPGPLIELIAKHQEQDPYCKRIVRQAFYLRWQPDLASAATGPGGDDYTVQYIPGGIRDLLCVARCVIVPAQTSLCIELLC